MTSALLVVGGLAALVVGAELLVRAATILATWLGIRPMVIGLTVVSLGTSVPELAVGIDAARSGSPALAVGNIVGTNLVNILLILGLSSVIAPIPLARSTLRLDLPAMTAVAVLLAVLSLDGTLTTPDGVVLLLGGIAYTTLLVLATRRKSAHPAEIGTGLPKPALGRRPWLYVLQLLISLVVVVIGAELLVDGAVSSARSSE